MAVSLVAVSLMGGCFWRIEVPPVPAPPPRALQALARDLPGQAVGLRIDVDSARGAVLALAGPFRLPPSSAGMQDRPSHVHVQPSMAMGEAVPLRFDWPVEGWMRGFELRIYDADGAELPSSFIHHFVVINFDRRDMVYPTVERLLGIGQETGDVVLPASIGVPLTQGQRMGMYAVWNNQLDHEIDVYLRLALRWTPATGRSNLRAVIPVSLDVNHTPGASSAYDIPSGRSTRSFDFQVPVDGRLLALSGHMHDFGIGVRLEDTSEGRQIAQIKAIRDEEGRVLRMEQKKRLGFLWRGVELREGRSYRVVAEYDNPQADTLRMGAMGHLVAVIAPEDWRAWPRIDPTDPEYQTDVAGWGLDMSSGDFMRAWRAKGSGVR